MKSDTIKKQFAIFIALLFSISGFAQNAPTGMALVNKVNEDFSYSIPLLEVPGINGNFPIVLNYNAGIKAEQEATWVGLGWSLDMGTIYRSD